MHNLLIVLAEVVHALLQGNQPERLKKSADRTGRKAENGES